MPTDAQRRATAKYKREKTKTKPVTFYPSDADILAWLESQPNQAGYVKSIIRADMERARDGGGATGE